MKDETNRCGCNSALRYDYEEQVWECLECTATWTPRDGIEMYRQEPSVSKEIMGYLRLQESFDETYGEW